MIKKMNKAYCPLIEFNRKCNEFEYDEDIIITDEIKIINRKNVPEINIISYNLSDIRLRQYDEVSDWLYVEGEYNFDDFEEIVNIFQLALWITKPTRVCIHFISNFEKEQHNRRFIYILHRFRYIPKHVKFDICKDDIKKIKHFLPLLVNLYHKRKRFRNAISLNFNACLSPSWQTDFMLMSAAFEALLTYGSRIDITQKLAQSYAVLTETNTNKLEENFKEFKRLYSIRSDIIHGASFKEKYKNGDINLDKLSKFSNMLRKLWDKILNSDEIIENLNGSDSRRRNFFKEISNNWRPLMKIEQ